MFLYNVAQKKCRRFWFFLFFQELEANEVTGAIFFFEPRSLTGRKKQTRKDIKIRRPGFGNKGC